MRAGDWAVVWHMARRTVSKTLRRPLPLGFSFVQPLLWMVFFGFLFARFPVADLPEGAGYLEFIVAGVSAMTVLLGASQSGIGWLRDLNSGFLPRMLRTPAPRWALLGGKLGADSLRLLVQALAVLVLARLLGARLQVSLLWLPVSIAPLLLFALAFSGLSCSLALWTKTQEVMGAFVHLVNMPILFTSTALVPHRQMPPWLGRLAAWNPLSLAVDDWRAALLHGDSIPSTKTLLVLGTLAAISWTATLWLLNRPEER